MRRDDVKNDLRELVFDFFFWFSKFESALKEERYLASDEVGAKAQPSWDKFVSRFRQHYQPNAAAIELIKAKPRRQIVVAQGLDFEDVPFSPNTAELDRVVTYAKTVRNNLFHGGKHGGDYWDDSVRMRLLLRVSIETLNDLARLGGLQQHYTGYY
jgi:hypothetical protein